MPTLRDTRQKRFLSQRELAELAKVSRTTVAMIESGQSRPYPRTARALAAALGVEPGEIEWPIAPDGVPIKVSDLREPETRGEKDEDQNN